MAFTAATGDEPAAAGLLEGASGLRELVPGLLGLAPGLLKTASGVPADAGDCGRPDIAVLGAVGVAATVQLQRPQVYAQKPLGFAVLDLVMKSAEHCPNFFCTAVHAWLD